MEFKSYKLSELVKRKKVSANIESEKIYKRVTVKLYHKGVVLRDEEIGANIKSSMFLVSEGDFILSGIDARNGAFGIVPKELEGAVITNDFWCLEPIDNLLDKEFFLFLTSTSFFDYICKICSDGTTQRIRLQKDKFFDFEISIPSLENQKLLVEKLKTVNESSNSISSEITHQIDLIKNLRQAFLREATQGLLVPNETSDDKTGADLLADIQAEKAQLVKDKKIKRPKPLAPISEEEIPFNIPKNWTWCRLGEFGDLKRGKSKHRPRNDIKLFENGTVPFIQTGDVARSKSNKDIIDTINGYYNEFGLAQSELQPKGTLCITIAANIAESGFLGFDACLPDSIVCFDTDEDYSKRFVHYFIRLSKVEIERFAPATAQKNINLGILNDLYFPLPPLKIQERIVAKLDELMSYCDALEEQVKQSQHTNEQLLQQVLREAWGRN